ncbi:MAG: NUDIX hydrolase [Bacillota bacterium]
MMVSFDAGSTRFHVRAGALFVDDGHVLLCQSDAMPTFWFPPGGRVDLMEASPETLRREMVEELGADVEVGRLLWVTENFFTLRERQFHEIGLYYRATFRDPAYLDKRRSWTGVVDGPYKITVRWFKLSELDQIEVRPPFVVEELRNLSDETRHIVHRA